MATSYKGGARDVVTEKCGQIQKSERIIHPAIECPVAFDKSFVNITAFLCRPTNRRPLASPLHTMPAASPQPSVYLLKKVQEQLVNDFSTQEDLLDELDDRAGLGKYGEQQAVAKAGYKL